MRDERIENLGREPASLPHSRKAFRPMQLDDSVLGLDAVVGRDGDVLSHWPKIGIAVAYGQQDPGRRLRVRRGPLPAQ